MERVSLKIRLSCVPVRRYHAARLETDLL